MESTQFKMAATANGAWQTHKWLYNFTNIELKYSVVAAERYPQHITWDWLFQTCIKKHGCEVKFTVTSTKIQTFYTLQWLKVTDYTE